MAKVVRSGGIAWIPAFALDRTQKVLYVLKKAYESGLIPAGTPLYCPSPSAGSISDLYTHELQTHAGNWFRPEIYLEPSLFPETIRRLPEPDKIPRPCIIVSTSGMMDKAFSTLLLEKLLPDPRTHVFLVGYQDPESPGGQLKEQAGKVFWEGKEINVNASVHSYGVFSAHADLNDMIRWLSNQDRDKVRLFLVHGGKQQLLDQQSALKSKGFKNVAVASPGIKYRF